MSKLAKKPVTIIEGVTVVQEGDVLKVTGVKGMLSFKIPQGVKIENKDNLLQIGLSDPTAGSGDGDKKALLGLTRAQTANMIKGVSVGFDKKLELSGVGYRAQVSGNELILTIGFSHPVKIKAVDGIAFSVEENIITIKGIDKELVGNTAATIRAIRPPEPYKGKGIKYKDEKIRRKAGKAVKALGAK